ncbi:hypothetical protein FB45DRAFT_359008 [Roridomyces roridus]|uniref:MYND-type domain-containing protein n=1 Tax=Roridomyces roridus TaxID=1738132 RepID=A0AAD7C7W8_9AGAR|nr:hypothetical protein FB45DRAFT_359008 [Roridomyces roridus]
MPLSTLARAEILSLLNSMGVDLPRKTKLSDEELEKRLSRTLDSTQYLTRVVPKPPFDPNAYPSWFQDKSNKPVLEAMSRHNVLEATMNHESRLKGIDNPVELYSNPAMDLRQTIMSIGNACDQGMVPVVVQDKDDSSGICMRVLQVKQFDKETPILVVLFQHDLKGAISPGGAQWMSSIVNSKTTQPLLKITATIQEQQLLLRLLYANSKRLVSSYKPKRASTETSFTLSFLLPVGPLAGRDIAKYNTNDGCSVCGDPAAKKCSRCGAARYCDAVCQKDDWKTHRALCNSLQNARWKSATFVSADEPQPGLFSVRISQYDIVQHQDTQKRMEALFSNVNKGPPTNTHGLVPFIVKVQLQSSKAKGPAYPVMKELGGTPPELDGKSFLVYDQRKTFEVMVFQDANSEVFDDVLKVIKSRGERAIKTFMWAIRTGDWTIDLCLDTLPDLQRW